MLDTGQKVHYERLKKHVPAPWDWTTHQPFRPDPNIAIIADPYVEDTNEEITSDVSRDSFLPEQLPEASFELEPTRPVPPRTIQTRTQTALERGIPRRRFSQFGYPSESDSEPEEPGPPPIISPSQVVSLEIDDLEPVFSDQEEILPPALTDSLIPSPSGISAPLLSNPSLTDTLSNFPLFNQRTNDPNNKNATPILTTRSRIETHLPQLPAGEVDLEADPPVAETNYPRHQAEQPRLPGNQPHSPEKAQEQDFPPGPHPGRLTEP